MSPRVAALLLASVALAAGGGSGSRGQRAITAAVESTLRGAGG